MDIIESATLERDGFTVRIDVVPDTDSSPHDADCYSPADIESWRAGEWEYVGFVYSVFKNGIELGYSAIWGTEWGFQGANSSIQEWIDENYYHPALLDEALENAKSAILELTKGV